MSRPRGTAPVDPVPTVLQVIQQGQLRGAEVFALDLCAELVHVPSWQASLLSLFAANPAYTAAVTGAGLTLAVAHPDGGPRGMQPRLVWRLGTIVEAGRFRVVQGNGAGTLKYLVAARRLARRPWRLVYRAIGMGSYWRRGVRRAAYAWLLAQVDLFIAVCRAVADDLVRAGVDPSRIVVVPNGVSPVRIAAQPEDRDRIRATLGLAPHDVALLYSGSLSSEKNLSALIRTVAACRAQGRPATAVLIGDGPEREALQVQAQRLGLETVVRLLPSTQRIGPYLTAADVCVLPSLTEGMPATVIEAGLNGTPAVAYAVGGIPEVIEDGITGLLVPARDEDAFVRAVAALVDDPARRMAMGQVARAHYRRFEIGAVAHAYLDAYARVAGAALTS